jgi:hypothetical protein
VETKIKTVLAINPGTRYLGLAAFQGNQLKDWRVKILKGRWSKKKLNKAVDIVTDCIERYRPDLLALKRFHPVRTSRGLESLITQLRRICLRKRIPLTQHSIKQLEEFFCREERKNKRNLAQSVAAHYPELYCELNAEYPKPKPGKKEKKKNPYHIRMFEAVALGAICVNEFDKN